MARKPVKIKRNTSISGKKYHRKAAAKKALSILFALGALLALGFFGAPAVAEMIQNIKDRPQQIITEPSAQPTATPGEIVEPTTNPGDVKTDILQQTNVCSIVDVKNLLTEDAIRKQAAVLKEKDVDFAVVTLKDKDGAVWYTSATEIGAQAVSKQTVDVKKVVEIFAENDINVVANVYTFMDKTAPDINRDTAVLYVGTDYKWLDTSKEFGGKAWANPASSAMQQYLYDLVQEIKTELGIKYFIFSGTQLPTGYSLDKRDFGVSDAALQAQLQGFIGTMQSKVAAFGGDAFFEFDLTAINGGDVAKYMVAPQRLGAVNIVVSGTTEEFAAADMAAVSRKLKEDFNVEKLVFRCTDGNLTDTIPEADDYFVQ